MGDRNGSGAGEAGTQGGQNAGEQLSADGRNLPPLRLHVPEPQFRPGDDADFSHFDIPPAGTSRRPDEAADAGTMREMAYDLVRVLDEEARAVGPWDPKLPPEVLLRMLRGMALTRAFDGRMFRAQRQGKTSFYMKSTGEEAVSIGAAAALASDDMCFPSYRQQGILIARGWPLVDMMNQIYSNKGDRLKGRQLPIMYSAREAGFFSISGNLATQYPQAVGWAMASAARGDTRIAATWCGGRIDGGRGFPFRLHLCERLSRAGHPECRQQPVGDQQLFRLCGRGGDDLCGAGDRLWHCGAADRRQ